MTPLDHALRAVDSLMVATHQLAANVMPGTSMPYRAPTLTLEQRAEADRRAREERHERINIAPGDSPDPYRMDVVDLLTDILVVADTLTEQLSRHLGLDHRHATSPMADPRPYLQTIRTYLPSIADEHPHLLTETEQQASRLTARADAMLGHITDGQHLRAVCCFCGGRDATHPTGGAHTLRVRILPGRDSEPVVVCEGGQCEPASVDCGTWWRGLPAWRVHEWDWLAVRLGPDAA